MVLALQGGDVLWSQDKLPAVAEGDVSYKKDVAPILEMHCLKCHGPQKQESGLRVDQKASLLRGGDFGEPSLIAGNSQDSFLIHVVAGLNPDLEMPPEGPALSPQEIGILRKWIDTGMNFPGDSVPAGATIDHWSFQPIRRPVVPEIRDSWVRNDIDRFILMALKNRGLRPQPAATPRELLRRIRLVEHGLPPTPEQMATYQTENSYSRLIREILSSEHYGERWARHWLDLVRFGETTGFEVNRERLNAWHYRDYVIEALNRDKPYDVFVMEQLAGDALGSDRATGYLVAGPNDLVKSQDDDFIKLQRQDELADMINTTGTTFLGLTLGCARCHSHKFDPITQKDYYSLQAVFAGVNHAERPLPATEAQQEQRVALGKRVEFLESALKKYRINPVLRPAVSFEWNQEQFQPIQARFVRFTVLRSSSGEPCIDELSVFAKTKNVGLATEGVTATASSEFANNHRHKIAHINDGLVGNDHSWISAQNHGGWVQLQFPEVTWIDRIEWARDRERKYRDRLPVEYRIEVAVEPGKWTTVASHEDRIAFSAQAEKVPQYDFSGLPDAARLEAEEMEVELGLNRQQFERLAKKQMVYGGTFSTPPAVYRLFRGDANAPRERVPPDAIEVLGSLGLAMDTPEQQRRLRLAEWMVATENPLTARVIVNRIWQHCFGIGLVDTPSDFGTAGSDPTHPELLDYLASELRDHQWSLKHIHRLILESSTFRQASVPVKAALQQDADTRYLWRFPPRRLEAEAIRDSILAVSGALDLRRGGPGFSGFQVEMENVRHYFPLEEFGPPQWRRMIYQTKVRQEQDAVFGVFDCPDASQVVAKRSRSTTPLQALNLLNSRFVMQQAGILSARLEMESPKSAASQVRRAFELAYTRRPVMAEVNAGKALIERFGLPAFCRALLNSNEFLFIQ